MNYQVPPKPPEPRQRYVVVTDPLEIEAMVRSGLRDPIGKYVPVDELSGEYWAEAHSLAQYRGLPVEFIV